jgi:hypothetical protein
LKSWRSSGTPTLTDFEQDLEEVSKPLFVRTKSTLLPIELQPAEVQHLKRIARSKGVKDTTLIRRWIRERLQEFSMTGRRSNKALSRPCERRAAAERGIVIAGVPALDA